MSFVPAGEIIEGHRVRQVTLKESPQLPDGMYEFIDQYCTDPDCDCRKTMIQVVHEGQRVATISFGWEPPEYYTKWMGMGADDQFARDMSGASIDMSSPDRLNPDAILAFFNALMNHEWLGMMKANYAAVKAAVAKGN
jgi:hypothetical protein